MIGFKKQTQDEQTALLPLNAQDEQAAVLPLIEKDEQAAVLPLVALLIVAIIGIVGLVLDLSRLEATIRLAQNAVDAAALAGATPLETTRLANAQEEIDDWAKVKKTILLSLANGQMMGLDSTTRTSLCVDGGSCTPSFRFDDTGSTATSYDCAGYNHTDGQRGNLAVTAERLLYCYWQEPWADPATAPITRQVFSVENNVNHFCKANAVSVDLKISGIKTAFSSVMGFDRFSDIEVSATAYMEEPIPAIGSLCQSINCNAIGIRDLLEARGLIPNPEPTPWPGTSPPAITLSPCNYTAPLPAPTCP